MITASPEHATDTSQQTTPLRDSVQRAIENYFSHLDGHPVSDLYDMVLSEIEEPLLQTVMRYTKGNQSKAAEVLGLSRGTLRKKLERYDMLQAESRQRD